MDTTALLIFALTYLGIALGGIPGLAIDRTGLALLGAIAMVVAGVETEAEAMAAIDLPTILLLFSFMVISSQFRLGGFYTQTAMLIARTMDRPRLFLFYLMGVSALMSALLANDIICLAFTPVLAVALVRARLQPVPFLLALALASNIGSAATIIGNPQNMLIGQVGQLHFGRFFAWCVVPVAASLGAAYGLVLALHRDLRLAGDAPVSVPAGEEPAYDHHQSRKGWILAGAVVVLFFTSFPRELTALCAAGILLCSRRMSTRSLLGLVDWHLITLFCGLFIVMRGLEASGLPAQAVAWMEARAIDLADYRVLSAVSVLLSNVVSNVPATMLLVKFLDPADPMPWYVLALTSTFAGNLITIGSIANLIVFEQAALCGIKVSFWQHARVGIPVTAVSILITLLWVAWVR